MKTAKEMFEELGYKQIRNSEEFIGYEKNGRNISFELETHTFSGVHVWLDFQAILIDAKELQAINRQFEELGWLDKETKDYGKTWALTKEELNG